MSNSTPPLAWILLALLSVIWGIAYILIKYAVKVFDPLEMGMLRMSVATMVLLPIAIRDMRHFSRRDLPFLLVVGICGNLLPSVLFPLAQRTISSAEAGVLNALSPVFIVIISFLVFQRRYAWINVLGIVVGLAGAIILIVGGAGGKIDFDGKTGGAMFVVVGTICYALSSNFVKQYFGHYPPKRLTAFSIVLLGLPTMLYMLAFTQVPQTIATHPDGWRAFGMVAVLGAIMTALAVVLFYRMLQLSSLVFASLVTYTAPVVVTIVALFDHEVLGWSHVAGMAVILIGVFLVNRK
jgi:drug/metabolite transporter (DMT)-like permease